MASMLLIQALCSFYSLCLEIFSPGVSMASSLISFPSSAQRSFYQRGSFWSPYIKEQPSPFKPAFPYSLTSLSSPSNEFIFFLLLFITSLSIPWGPEMLSYLFTAVSLAPRTVPGILLNKSLFQEWLQHQNYCLPMERKQTP